MVNRKHSRLVRRIFMLVALLGVVLASVVPLRASSSGRTSLETVPDTLKQILNGGPVRLDHVITRQAVDVDLDGRKEILFHGEGRIVGISTGVTMVQPREKSYDAQGRLILHPLQTSGDRIYGVYWYDTSSGSWAPLLLGCYRAAARRGGRWPRLLRKFQAVDLVGDPELEILVELAERGIEGQVHHKIYKSDTEGFKLAYSFSHAKFGIGEVQVAKNILWESKGVRSPFQGAAVYYQSLRATTVYRWQRGAYRVARRLLCWHDFHGNLSLSNQKSLARVRQPVTGRARRRVLMMQEAKDAGRLPARGDPLSVARMRGLRYPLRARAYYQKDGLCIVGLTYSARRGRSPEEIVYLYQPFFKSRGVESIWVAAGEFARP